jgi:hypothetical protein
MTDRITVRGALTSPFMAFDRLSWTFFSESPPVGGLPPASLPLIVSKDISAADFNFSLRGPVILTPLTFYWAISVSTRRACLGKSCYPTRLVVARNQMSYDNTQTISPTVSLAAGQDGSSIHSHFDILGPTPVPYGGYPFQVAGLSGLSLKLRLVTAVTGTLVATLGKRFKSDFSLEATRTQKRGFIYRGGRYAAIDATSPYTVSGKCNPGHVAGTAELHIMTAMELRLDGEGDLFGRKPDQNFDLRSDIDCPIRVQQRVGKAELPPFLGSVLDKAFRVNSRPVCAVRHAFDSVLSASLFSGGLVFDGGPDYDQYKVLSHPSRPGALKIVDIVCLSGPLSTSSALHVTTGSGSGVSELNGTVNATYTLLAANASGSTAAGTTKPIATTTSGRL